MPRKPSIETPHQREQRLRRQAEYRARVMARDPEAFRAKQNAATRKYVANNPEKAKASTERWRQANMDKFNDGRRKWRAANIVRALFNEARYRAKARGVDFTITLKDIPPMGEVCPLLGLPFSSREEKRSSTSPSIDRIRSDKGYVPGNVWIVGYRANLIKNDGTAEEHEMIAAAMRRVGAP